MSVTLSRFVRVMTDGRVVTDKLVKKLDSKLAARIASVEAIIADIEGQGAPASGLKDHVRALKDVKDSAGKAQNNSAKSDLLEHGKALAKRAVAEARQQAEDAPALAVTTKLRKGLEWLADENAKIPDAFLHPKAAEKLADLVERRKKLLAAGNDPQDAQQLLKEVGWAQGWTEDAIAFGTGSKKINRELARSGAALYAREGMKLTRQKDPAKSQQGKELIRLAKSLEDQLAAAELDAKRNPREATLLIMRMLTDLMKAQAIYKAEVLAPVITPGVDTMIAADPNGPEAAMQESLSPQLFKDRLLSVHNVAKLFGSPEMALLSPGEAVALFSYTTGDYKKMNGLLLKAGVGTGPADDDERKVQTVIDQTLNAMAKLPVHPAAPTSRGETPWPGDALQYTVGNEFKLKIFWSTGMGFTFPGTWQIKVFGKSGKNVAAFSNSPHESEVLFPPGCKFRVKSVVPSPGGGNVVVEEV